MKKIDAVVILYNPSAEQVSSFVSAIKEQVNTIHFVDNSDKTDKSVFYSAFDTEKSSYISMDGNKGVAAAQNMGVNLAFKNGADFIILFDQDSHVKPNFVEQLMECYLLADAQLGGKVAAVGPTPISDVTGQAYDRFIDRLQADKNSFTSIRQVIASGCLIPKEAWDYVGEMKSELFIDTVDHEWCWRAIYKGMKVIRSNEVFMPHRLGWYDVNLGVVKFSVGAPIRHYYQYRNYIYLLKLKHVPLYWKVRTGFSYLIKIIIYPFLVYPRISRLKYMLLGFKDGVLNKMGKFY